MSYKTDNLVSVIVPVYNHAHTLWRSFDSLSKQTHRSVEVIIVDDGSTDGFGDVAKKIEQSSPFPIRIIRQSNAGASAARNRGYREASGEYVIFWDADTIAKPKMLETMLGILQSNPAAAYAYSQFRFGWKKIKSRPFDADVLKKMNYIDTTSLVRRCVLSNVPGPFDVSLKRFQDWDLWLTLLKNGYEGIFIKRVLFTKIVIGRKGMSRWLPSFFYLLPWQTKPVIDFMRARAIVAKKHSIP